MTKIEETWYCHICGEPTTRYFADNENLPLCPSVVCEQATLDKINAALNDAVQTTVKE